MFQMEFSSNPKSFAIDQMECCALLMVRRRMVVAADFWVNFPQGLFFLGLPLFHDPSCKFFCHLIQSSLLTEI
jgi:hypothetical protein